MATIAGSSSDDFITPTANGGDYRGGQGNDTYLISALVPAGAAITITDTEGTNKIQLADGLTIASSTFTANAVQLTLSNGAVITLLGASTFAFDIGANASAGDAATTPNQTYAQFAATLGVPTLPTGSGTASGTPNYSVPVSGAVSAPTFTVTGAAAAAEGTDASFVVSLANRAAGVTYGTTVALAATGGATAGTDFASALTLDAASIAAGITLVGGVLTIPAASTVSSVTLKTAISADTLSPETGEGLSLTLSSPTGTGAVIGAVSSVTTAITDVPVSYELTASAANVTEGVAITYTLTATAAAATDTNVAFSVVPGDVAAANQGTSNTNLNDFAQGAFNPATVVLLAGQKTASYTVTAAADAITELPENYSVKAEIGGVAVATKVTSLLDGTAGGVGQTFTLTTNLDAPGATSPAVNTLGTSGNDTYNGVLDSLTAANNSYQALDNIDGALGIDTLNIIGNGAGANTVTPLFLTNVEKVVVRDVDATLTTTVNLANATGVTDVINDSSVANVVFNNISTAAVTAKNLATAGLDTTFTRGAAPVTAALTINLENLGTAAVVGAAAVQTGKVESNDGNNDATSVIVNATGYVDVVSANLTGTGVAGTHTAETVTINAAGTTKFGTAGGADDITGFNTAKLGKIVVTGAGAVTLNTLAGAVKTVDASANTGGVTLAGTTYTGTEATGVASNGLIITGGSGNDSITLNAVATAVVAAGAGNDTVNVSAGLVAVSKIGGGDGTADKIVITGVQAALLDDQDTAGTNLRATLTGFEQIGITGALDVANNFNMAQAGGYNYLAVEGDVTGIATVIGFTTGATVEFRTAANQATALNIGVTDAALTSTDSVNLKLNADLLSGSNFAVKAGVSGVNIVNVVANDRVNNVVDDNLAEAAADNGPDDGYTLTLGDGATTSANLTNLNISGTSFVSYTVSPATNALKVIDASASTGNAVLVATNFAGTERLEIKGAQGTNTITGSATAFGEKITGGAKADSINGAAGADDMTGNGGRDAFLFAATADSGTTASTVDQITDFGLVTATATGAEVLAMNNVATFQATATAKGGVNADLLSFTTLAVLGAAAAATDVVITLEALEVGDQFAGKVITVTESGRGLLTIGGADAAMVDTLAEWVAVANQAAGIPNEVVQFAFGGNTYVFQQVTAVGTTDDTLIELTGVTGATGITLLAVATATEVGNIFVI